MSEKPVDMNNAEMDLFLNLDQFVEDGISPPSPSSAMLSNVSPAESLFSDFGMGDLLFEEPATLPLFDALPETKQQQQTGETAQDNLFDSMFPDVSLPLNTTLPNGDELLALIGNDVNPGCIPSPEQSPPLDALLSPAVSPAPLAFLSVPSTPTQAPPLSSFSPSPVLANAQDSIRALFPQLAPTVERVRAALLEAVSKPQLTAQQQQQQRPPIAPAVSLPLLSTQMMATAAASAGTQTQQQLQQQLQALVNMHAKQMNNGPVVKASIEAPMPSYAVGRKRKEPPTDAAALMAEIDFKRQKNTEAARRSRARKVERLAFLEKEVKKVGAERDAMAAKVAELEAGRGEQVRLKERMELLERKLKEAGLEKFL
ncbi:hypothetical protein HK104_009862 [Borealophlyctis nickersoniae]|nr:hypothetical protein HK104_009862 [Borealophlyctis nickersoniae]